MQSKMLTDIETILSLELLTESHPIAVSSDSSRLAVVTQNHNRKQISAKKGDRFLSTGPPIFFEGSEIRVIDVKSGESQNLTPNWGTSYFPVWSPDGKKLAFYSDRNGKNQLYIWEDGENEPYLVSDATIRSFYRDSLPIWTLDGMHIIVKLLPEIDNNDETKLNENSVYVKVFTNDITETPPEVKDDPDSRSDPWWPLGVEKLFSSDVCVISVTTGEVRTLAQGLYPFGIRISPDGKKVAVMSFRGYVGLENAQQVYGFHILSLDGTKPKLLADSLRHNGLLFSWSPDGRYIAYGTTGYPLAIQESKNEIYLVSASDGRQICLTEDTDHALVNSTHPPLWSSDSRYLYCVARSHLWRITIADRSIEKLTDRFDRQVVRIVQRSNADTVWSSDNDESVYIQTVKGNEHGFHRVNLKTLEITKLVTEERVYNPNNRNMDVAPKSGDIFYTIEDINHPADVWIVNGNSLKSRQLTYLNPEIKETHFGSSKVITWQTPTGKELKGALLFPEDYTEGKSYPVITEVYGGSFLSRMSNDFGTDGIGHRFLLTRNGYVVFLPDMPMQSHSPIQELTESVLSGIDTLIDIGIADSKRLGVMGHSYGGYCVNALITQTTRFAAAVASSSICNLISFTGFLTEDGDSPWITWTEKSQGKMGGSIWDFRERYIENSPIFFLDNVETPILLVVGALEKYTALQAGEMFSGLRRLGKKVVLVRYEDEGHVPQKGRYPNAVDYWQRVLTWFDEHLAESSEGI